MSVLSHSRSLRNLDLTRNTLLACWRNGETRVGNGAGKESFLAYSHLSGRRFSTSPSTLATPTSSHQHPPVPGIPTDPSLQTHSQIKKPLTFPFGAPLPTLDDGNGEPFHLDEKDIPGNVRVEIPAVDAEERRLLGAIPYVPEKFDSPSLPTPTDNEVSFPILHAPRVTSTEVGSSSVPVFHAGRPTGRHESLDNETLDLENEVERGAEEGGNRTIRYEKRSLERGVGAISGFFSEFAKDLGLSGGPRADGGDGRKGEKFEFENRELDEKEESGLWVLGGILAGGWVVGWVLGPGGKKKGKSVGKTD